MCYRLAMLWAVLLTMSVGVAAVPTAAAADLNGGQYL